MTPTLTPLLKRQVDELFLHWFSEVETQKELRRELSNIRNDPLANGCSSPSNLAFTGTNTNNRPQSPPIPPSSPTLTPRSPRRKSSSFPRRSSQRSISLSNQEDDAHEPKLLPGYAKDIIKPFHFPFGKPEVTNGNNNEAVVVALKNIFRDLPNNVAKFEHFKLIVNVCGYPLYWKSPFFNACGGKANSSVTLGTCISTYQRITSNYHDKSSQLFHMLVKKNKKYLEIEDFESLLKDIIHTHPGLQFLLEAPEFHSRYIVTVITRIFYVANRCWNGRLSLLEFRRSNLLQVLVRLEEVEDINEVTDYFSYEHFYVFYCKFWELDTDHDMVISQHDLSCYSNGSISDVMIERLFSGCITRGTSFKEKTMTYVDFVWFLLSEVDKITPTAVEYWFRCMDLDGDGVITMFEMEYFYNDQIRKMEELGMETLSFSDCLCQIYDMVNPKVPNQITLRDLKSCKMAPNFFDTFFNLERWLEHEQKAPFQLCKDGEEEPSAWDRYVLEEYELLVAEEGGTQSIDYDDFEMDDETYEELLKPSFDDPGEKWNIKSSLGDKNDLFYK